MAAVESAAPVDPDAYDEVKEDRPVAPPTQPVHVFLLAGQSNMAGRGVLIEDSSTSAPRNLDDRIFLWRDGSWVSPAAHPLHQDKESAGVGPGLAFAKEILESLPLGERCVGLVPAAVGGAAVSRWEPQEGDLFARAAESARAAVAASGGDARLSGILWHQGESDADDDSRAAAYPEALARVARALPEACLPDTADLVPVFIAAELGVNFLDAKRFPSAKAVNAAICELPEVLGKEERVACVCSAQGLTHIGDHLHFDTASAEILGRRYAYTWLTTEGLLATHDFSLSPGLLNDEKPRPWYAAAVGILTCST